VEGGHDFVLCLVLSIYHLSSVTDMYLQAISLDAATDEDKYGR
jgi:hypothetical protein